MYESEGAECNANVEDKIGTGGATFEGVFSYGLMEMERIV